MDNAMSREILAQAKRIVVKVGSRVLVQRSGRPDIRRMAALVRDLVAVRELGREVVLVSSGAIACGMEAMGLRRRPEDLPTLQMAAAVGQNRLMALYDRLFAEAHCRIGQVLLTHADLENRQRHLNAKHCLRKLLEHGAVPVVNENDAVSTDEIKFGDNDALASRTAMLLQADLLVLLTTVDGFRVPGADGREHVVSCLPCVDEEALSHTAGKGSPLSTGGMASKLGAAAEAAQTPEDFKGKLIACFRMETGHMVTKSWLREQGLKIGNSAEEVDNGTADVAFILLENSAAEVAAVENGEVDMCFVNSGYGYVATQGGKCAIAFQPQELIGHEFPCCRQSTNRAAYEEKKSALVKFEIANIRAMYDIANDKEGVIKDIMDYSGQDEAYVEAITYGNADYVAAMQFEMDPRTDDVKDFYGDMIDNGDIENDDKQLIVDHLDSSIYKAALETLIARGENASFYEGLMKKYEAHNTLGV